MNIAEYQNFCSLILKKEYLYSCDLVVSGKVAPLLELKIAFENDEDFIELINSIIQVGEANNLGLLQNKLEMLSKPALSKIQRLINRTNNKIVDQGFATRVAYLLRVS